MIIHVIDPLYFTDFILLHVYWLFHCHSWSPLKSMTTIFSTSLLSGKSVFVSPTSCAWKTVCIYIILDTKRITLTPGDTWISQCPIRRSGERLIQVSHPEGQTYLAQDPITTQTSLKFKLGVACLIFSKNLVTHTFGGHLMSSDPLMLLYPCLRAPSPSIIGPLFLQN